MEMGLWLRGLETKKYTNENSRNWIHSALKRSGNETDVSVEACMGMRLVAVYLYELRGGAGDGGGVLA